MVSPDRHCRGSCTEAMVLCPRGKFLPDSIQTLLDPSCSVALFFNPCSIPPLLAAPGPSMQNIRLLSHRGDKAVPSS